MADGMIDLSLATGISVDDLQVWAIVIFALVGLIANLLKKLQKKPDGAGTPGQPGPAGRPPTPSSPAPRAEARPVAVEPARVRRPGSAQPVPGRGLAPVARMTATPAAGRVPPAFTSAAVPPPGGQTSPVPVQVGRLLRDRKSLQAAFVLSELLAPPLALRAEPWP